MATAKKKINDQRRKIMRWLTKGVGASSSPTTDSLAKINRIFISRPNHRLGNLLLVTPLIQEVVHIFPNCKITLLVQGGVSEEIFKNYENIERIIIQPKKPFKYLGQYLKSWLVLRNSARFDLAINTVASSSSGRLTTAFCRSRFKIFGDSENTEGEKKEEPSHIAKAPVVEFWKFLRSAGIEHENRSPFPLNLKLADSELRKGKDLLATLTTPAKKTIALFTYATGAKCLKKDWWLDFHQKLKDAFPEYNMIEILPVENISNLSFTIPSFYSKDIREIAALMANTDLFVGADSGMMHLAVASGVTTIGLFSVTNAIEYAPYGGKNTWFDTDAQDADALVKLVSSLI